jgi:hypothetical protein
MVGASNSFVTATRQFVAASHVETVIYKAIDY